MRFSTALLASILLTFVVLSGNARAYSDQFYIANVTLQPAGGAHVTETTVISLTSSDEVQAFETAIQSAASLTDWRRFSKNVGYHFNGLTQDTHITGKRDVSLGVPVGVVIVDYDLNYTVAVPEQTGTRITRYTLGPDVLNFPGPSEGESTLLNGMSLTFKLPSDATLVSAEPSVFERHGNDLTWKGALTGRWRLTYDREIPLSQEVNQFFSDAYHNGLTFIPILLLVILLAFVGLKMIGRRNK